MRSERTTYLPPVVRSCEACGAEFRTWPSVIRKGNGRWCSKRCAETVRRHRPPLELPSALWDRVDRSGDGCWPWTGHRDPDGYGMLQVAGVRYATHRLAYTLTYGEPPADKPCILHSCDNPPCCRPDHLFPGTDVENMADKVTKERQARGSGIAWAKLTEGQVVQIRSLHAGGTHTPSQLGRLFGVTKESIYGIVKRKTWKHC